MTKFTDRIARRGPDMSPTDPARGDAGHAAGRGLWWTFAAGLVVAAAILVAIVQNGRAVSLHYLVWDVHVSLIVVILTTALLAILLDEIGGLVWRRRRRAKVGRRSELERLRARQEPAARRSSTAGPASPEV
jgi:uncharacterized integral membrane protein